MSLYKHVDNRDKLFDAVVDRIVNELSEDDQVPGRRMRDGGRIWPRRARIRRYARAHPHAFPLVATRPTEAPWINPPLRSVEWIEAFLSGCPRRFHRRQVLFAYRTFNGFLLGYLLLETSAMAVHDPLPGDGAYAPSGTQGATNRRRRSAVPGSLTPTRSKADRRDISEVETSEALIDPQDNSTGSVSDRLSSNRRFAEDHFDRSSRRASNIC